LKNINPLISANQCSRVANRSAIEIGNDVEKVERLMNLVVSTGVNRRHSHGCKQLPINQSLHTAHCGIIVPKVCHLTNHEKSEKRQERAPVQGQARLIFNPKKIYCAIPIIYSVFYDKGITIPQKFWLFLAFKQSVRQFLHCLAFYLNYHLATLAAAGKTRYSVMFEFCRLGVTRDATPIIDTGHRSTFAVNVAVVAPRMKHSVFAIHFPFPQNL